MADWSVDRVATAKFHREAVRNDGRDAVDVPSCTVYSRINPNTKTKEFSVDCTIDSQEEAARKQASALIANGGMVAIGKPRMP